MTVGQTSTEIATVQAANTAGTLRQRMEYAQALAQASLLPKHYQKNPANVLVAIEYGHALGMAAIEAINSIHVVEGKPTMSADLMAARVRLAGHKLRVIENDDGSVEAHLIRSDDPDFVFRVRWDDAKAKAAGLLGKGNWSKYKSQMLRARAVSEVCRQGANDALHGVIYVPEELGAVVAEDGQPVVLAGDAQQQVDVSTGEVLDAETETWEALIDACETVEELRDLYRKAAGLPDVQAAIGARATRLQQAPDKAGAAEQGDSPESDEGSDAEPVDAEIVEDDEPTLDVAPERDAA